MNKLAAEGCRRVLSFQECEAWVQAAMLGAVQGASEPFSLKRPGLAPISHFEGRGGTYIPTQAGADPYPLRWHSQDSVDFVGNQSLGAAFSQMPAPWESTMANRQAT